MWVPMEVHIFRSVPLRDYFSLRAPSGPLMGTLSGAHVGTPMGHPLFKIKLIIISHLFPYARGSHIYTHSPTTIELIIEVQIYLVF